MTELMTEATHLLSDGRTVGFAHTRARRGVTAVLWCHGAPGSRLEPAHVADQAHTAGLRLVGIDRPGYGSSTPKPGRSIAEWSSDAVAVADHLGIGRFVVVGTSTGGAFALAVAAYAPERVLGVVACCSITDMRWPEARATMSRPHTHAVWDARDRSAAMMAAVEAHGEHGEKLQHGGMAAALAPSDVELFRDPQWMALAMDEFPVMFAQGLEGYTDDRLADGVGWSSFDVSNVRCPVTVLHGASDRMVDITHARHTAEILPGARITIIDGLGHFSIIPHIIPAILELLTGCDVDPAVSD